MALWRRDDVDDWIDRNQLGRRNLHPDQVALLIGRRYNRAKKAHGGDRGNQHTEPRDHFDPLPAEKTAQSIARQHGLGEATVKRAGQFADAIEKVKAIAPSIARALRRANRADFRCTLCNDFAKRSKMRRPFVPLFAAFLRHRAPVCCHFIAISRRVISASDYFRLRQTTSDHIESTPITHRDAICNRCAGDLVSRTA